MEKHLLSKSTFIRGVQCLKSLYLNKKRPFLRDRLPQERLLVFKRGHRVGDLAQQLFPGGINMSPGHPSAYRKAIINTQEKISEGVPVIYEAGFQHDQVMILLDILVHSENGWHAYEVKSSGGISDTYLMDAALQYHVIKGSGLEISGISIVHIDKEYMLEDHIDIHKLFKIVDVTDEALSRQEYIETQIVKEKETLLLPNSPKIDVGGHCRKPYDCDFLGHCWKNIPAADKTPPGDQIDKAIAANMIDKEVNSAFIKLLPIRPAIPMYKGTHPYQEIIYGYGFKTNTREEIAFFDHDTNPQDKLSDVLNSQLGGIKTVYCFGQAYILSEMIKGDTQVVDLKEALLPDTEFFTEHKDIGELERLKLIFLSSEQNSKPAYSSDAIAEHYYLTEFDKSETKEKLQEYAVAWGETLESFWKFCRTDD